MNRRRYLATVAGLSGLLAGCAADEPADADAGGPTPAVPGPSRATTLDGTDLAPPVGWALGEFDRVVDAVDDAGCDPTGGAPCGPKVVDAVGESTLVRFPEGTYRFDEPIPVAGLDQVGFAGTGDVRFTYPAGYNQFAFVFRVGSVLFSGIDLDVRARNATAGLKFRTDRGFRVRDVRQVGRGNHPDREVVHLVVAEVKDSDATGVIENLVATQGSAIGQYKAGDGRGGVYVGQYHRGTVRIVDCHLEEFGNNGLYCSRTPGDVEVIGGLYRNNNASNVRISGAGSYVENATIEVDIGSYDGPRGSLDSAFNPRGVVVEQGPLVERPKPAGAEVKDCDVAVVDAPERTQGGIHLGHTGREVTVENTRIRVDADRVPGVYAEPTEEGERYPPASPPRRVRLRDVTVAGGADTGEAVRLVDAAGSELLDCKLRATGRRRDGVRLVRSPAFLVDGGTVSVSGYPLLVEFDGREPDRRCLVSVRNDPRLHSTADGFPDGETIRFPLVTRSGSSDSDDSASCLPVDRLPEGVFRTQLALFGAEPGSIRGAVVSA